MLYTIPSNNYKNLLFGDYTMPRSLRKLSKTGIYHVILRGINRQDIFLDDEDFASAIENLEKCKPGICKTTWIDGKQTAVIEGSFKLYGYCLMTNHIHLLVKSIASEGNEVPADTDNLSIAIKRFAGSYAQNYNFKYQRCGALFQDRFRSEPVEDEAYFLTVMRYIHQNPLKAGITNDLSDYQWSSYKDYQHQSGITDRGLACKLLGNQFTSFMTATNDDKCLEMDLHKLDDIELCKIIHEEFNILAGQVSGLKLQHRNQILRKAKTIPGVTAIQLARVTGVQVNIIWRLDSSDKNKNPRKTQQMTLNDEGG
jgi:REP element-mobilizing transposase RayT